jgi:hypothetical protein
LILGAPWPFARLQLHDTRVTVPLAQLQSRLSFKVASQQPLIQMNLDPSITLGSNTCLSNLTGACPMPRAPCPTPRASCPAPRALRPSLTALCRQRSRRPWPSPRSTPARRAPASSTTRTVGPRPQARGACPPCHWPARVGDPRLSSWAQGFAATTQIPHVCLPHCSVHPLIDYASVLRGSPQCATP